MRCAATLPSTEFPLYAPVQDERGLGLLGSAAVPFDDRLSVLWRERDLAPAGNDIPNVLLGLGEREMFGLS